MTAIDWDSYNAFLNETSLLADLEENALLFVAVVIPLAIYFLILAWLNRSRHPVMVSGVWDFVGVLFAASGIIYLGGTAILNSLYEHWRVPWLLGQTRFLPEFAQDWNFWTVLWFVYFAVIVAGSALVLRRRRRQTSIYNVEPAIFEEVLVQVFERLGLEVIRSGPRRILVRVREGLTESGGGGVMVDSETAPPSSQAITRHASPAPAQQTLLSTNHWLRLDLEPFPLMRHMTLHWGAESGLLRLEIETALEDALARVRSRHNPVSTWFLALAACLFLLTFLILVGLLVYLLFFLGPR